MSLVKLNPGWNRFLDQQPAPYIIDFRKMGAVIYDYDISALLEKMKGEYSNTTLETGLTTKVLQIFETLPNGDRKPVLHTLAYILRTIDPDLAVDDLGFEAGRARWAILGCPTADVEKKEDAIADGKYFIEEYSLFKGKYQHEIQREERVVKTAHELVNGNSEGVRSELVNAINAANDFASLILPPEVEQRSAINSNIYTLNGLYQNLGGSVVNDLLAFQELVAK